MYIKTYHIIQHKTFRKTFKLFKKNPKKLYIKILQIKKKIITKTIIAKLIRRPKQETQITCQTKGKRVGKPIAGVDDVGIGLLNIDIANKSEKLQLDCPDGSKIDVTYTVPDWLLI